MNKLLLIISVLIFYVQASAQKNNQDGRGFLRRRYCKAFILKKKNGKSLEKHFKSQYKNLSGCNIVYQPIWVDKGVMLSMLKKIKNAQSNNATY